MAGSAAFVHKLSVMNGRFVGPGAAGRRGGGELARSRTRFALAVLALAAFAVAGLGASAEAAQALDCPGKPDALGTSRTLVLAAAEHPRLGTQQYPQTLDLSDGEVVLTFDDGPLRPNTTKVLDALAAECVKATFFVVGAMAAHAPDLVRRAFDEGHTIGTHTQTHPHLPALPDAKAKGEIDRGIASAEAALTPSRRLAPFFRAPYLQLTRALDTYVTGRGETIWGIDLHAGDWEKVTPAVVVSRVIERLGRARKGILLLHDIQARTAEALPQLLRALKTHGYRIVHVVPRGAEHAGLH